VARALPARLIWLSRGLPGRRARHRSDTAVLAGVATALLGSLAAVIFLQAGAAQTSTRTVIAPATQSAPAPADRVPVTAGCGNALADSPVAGPPAGAAKPRQPASCRK